MIIASGKMVSKVIINQIVITISNGNKKTKKNK